MRCDVVCYRPNVQAPLFCYQMEMSIQLPVVIQSIPNEARKHNRLAQQMAAWIQINERGLRQRYAQELERKCGTGNILFMKGDILQLIKNAGGFEQQAALWDSPHNLQRMMEMQNEVLTHRRQLGATTRLYGGMVTKQFAKPGGVGTLGQPNKFYAPLLQLMTLVLYADEDVDSMINRHFKLGMPRLELGQYLIANEAKVDLTKEGRQMLQARERGMRRSEPQTGRQGITTVLDQIATYRSVFRSEMGDPVPTQQLPTTMDDAVPPLSIIAFRPNVFKWPWPRPPQLLIDRPTPQPLARLTLHQSPRQTPHPSRAPSVTSSVQVGDSAAEVSQRLREQSPSPVGTGHQRQEHESQDKTKKTSQKEKPKSKGGFDMAMGPGALAGPSHVGWQAPVTPQAGQKRAAEPSQSPKKTPSKVPRHLVMQYQLSQEDLRLPSTRVYLPSAPMGAPRAFNTSKRNVASGAAKWENIDCQVRDNQQLYTRQGQQLGTVMTVLQQPAQPIEGCDEPLVPHIQDNELHVRNARIRLKDQARLQNIIYFVGKEEERQAQKQSTAAQSPAVAQIMSAMADQQPPPPSADAATGSTMPQPPLADPVVQSMNMGQPGMEQKQDGISTGDGNGVQGKDDSGAAMTKKA